MQEINIRHIIFTDRPEQEDRRALEVFYNMHGTSFLQHPEWKPTDPRISGLRYFFTKNEKGKILSSALIYERDDRRADIYFGPLLSDESLLAPSLTLISEYYKKKFFSHLNLNLPNHKEGHILCSDSGFLKSLKAFKSDAALNWATLKLNLAGIPGDEILNSFSVHHRKEIQRGLKAGLIVAPLKENEIEELALLHFKMYSHRGLQSSVENAVKQYRSVYEFIKNTGKGFISAVSDKEGRLLGGAAILYNHDAGYYYLGVADPQERKLPISYMALFDGIKQAREAGLTYFDFGGYKLNASETDQVAKINWFKEGFGGKLVVYPPTLQIILHPFLFRLTAFLKRLYSGFLFIRQRLFSRKVSTEK